MAVPRLNFRITNRQDMETYGTDNEVMRLGFTLPDTAAANAAVLEAIQNLQAQVDQQVEVFNFGGQTVVATLNWLTLRQDPGQSPYITLELEHTSAWDKVPTI
jgi:hypothetical protein